jgi:hypothetical protein
MANEMRLLWALKRTAAVLRLKVRLIALTLLRPARLRRAFTSVGVQGRRVGIDDARMWWDGDSNQKAMSAAEHPED